MSARHDILERIRRPTIASAPLPELAGPWIFYPDREQQFRDVLTAVGGSCQTVQTFAEVAEGVQALPCFATAKQIACPIPEISLGNVDLAKIADPHELEPLDLAILPGQFGVAENAAVWVVDRPDVPRATYFLTQHLVLIVPRNEIVDNLHQAYERIAFPAAGYGLFISGPSKTADIEQALVIGAHGPRSLTVFLVGLKDT